MKMTVSKKIELLVGREVEKKCGKEGSGWYTRTESEYIGKNW